MPIDAATSGTLSMIAEVEPKRITTKSVLGKIEFKFSANENNTPIDSKAPTDKRIPKKTKYSVIQF